MEGNSTAHEMAPPPCTPRAALDAGGELWGTLSVAVSRLLDEIAGGAVLEVIAREPSTRADLPAWCSAAGHEIVRVIEDGDVTRFWIRKKGIGYGGMEVWTAGGARAGTPAGH